MQGIELSKAYFEAYGLSMLQTEFADFWPQLAVGLCGSGSECYGYDDTLSQDHDFEPGFCIFVPDGLDRRREFQLERAYAKLPKEFMGFQKSAVSAVGGNRHGVLHYSQFFKDKTGTPDGQLSMEDWFTLPSFSLLEATNGQIFIDNLGEVTRIRERLRAMPQDVRLKKLAGHLLLMAQAGQYNYNRLIKRKEEAAAQLALYEFVKSALEVIFLLNNAYMPYYKWSFRALSALPILAEKASVLEFLISTDNKAEHAVQKSQAIEALAAELVEELQKQKLLSASTHELEQVAYAINDRIEDISIRNAHILMAI